MTFYDLASQCERVLNETTTMASISFLPAQVGVVKSALQGLGKKKAQWKLEILEGDGETTVRFEDALEIKVPTAHWDAFQGIFDGALSNNTYLELAAVGLMDFIEESEEPLLEQRMAEIHQLVEGQLENPALQKADMIARRWISRFGEHTITNESGLIPLPVLETWKDAFVDELTEGCQEDLGQLEILLKSLQDFKTIRECACLAGGRITCQFQGVEVILEAHTGWGGVNAFSVAVRDDEVADAVEEAVIEVPRIGNVFYPRGGQMDGRLGGENFIDVLRETIEGTVETVETGDENDEEDS